VTLSGTITYDRVPFARTGGLDYANTRAMPARGVTLQVINAQNALVGSTRTNNSGAYSLSVAANTSLKVRVLAQLISTSPTWTVNVADNTRSNAAYVLEGSLASTGSAATQTRNLHAASGWGGSAYTQTRAAAPFAILDSMYDSLLLLASTDSQLQLPPLNVRWSENNVAASGNLALGFIGSSMYSSYDSTIYILGKANSDSDEYDRGVVQHEFGHFVEDKLSRSESIGGGHSLDSRIDMRVAFGEGWGNAFAGMSSGDSVYRDSMGSNQAQAFSFDVEDNNGANKGWFNERSVQSILFDIFDSRSDGADTISLGFAPLYRALTSSDYAQYSGLTSIYPVMALIQQNHSDQAAAIRALMQGQSIFGSGLFGEGESNDGGQAFVLPIYHSLQPGQNTSLCSNNQWQETNGADVRRFVLLNIPSEGQYTLSAKASGANAGNSDPDFRLWRNGSFALQSTSATAGSETVTKKLSPGTYSLEIYDSSNADDDNNSGGLVCFSVSLN
jgi:hypothetical protein